MVAIIVKWVLLIGLIIGLIQYVLIKIKEWQFKKLVKNQVSLAVVFGSLGQGKSLLFSWLVNRLENTYTNFWHKKKGNKTLLLDHYDIRGKVKIPAERAYYFVDEVNVYFRGVEYTKNHKEHDGVADFCAFARHFSKTIFFSMQRLEQLWSQIRGISNVYIKVKGIYTPFFLPWTNVLRIEVYEDLKVAEEWSSNMAPYQKGGFFSMFSGNDYDQAKKRLNIREYKVFLSEKDFNSYDTKFFGALLPLLNKNRKDYTVLPGKIPVPNALKDVIKEEFFDVQEKPTKNFWQKVKEFFSHQPTQDKIAKTWWTKLKERFEKPND